jgi:GT2 family glycosyltransferase
MVIKGVDRGQVRTAAERERLRNRIVDAARSRIGPVPVLGPAARLGLRGARFANRKRARLWALTKALVDRPGDVSSLLEAWRQGGPVALRDQARRLLGIPMEEASTLAWFRRIRPDARLLARFRRARWPGDAPRFSILTPVYNVREDWLRGAIESVIAQTYPHWELILINDASPAEHIQPTLDELASGDPRVKVIHLPKNGGVGKATNLGLDRAEGDYVAFMDHDDFLEPHALHRFAQAALADHADLIYSDEALTSEDIDDILQIPLRSSFSYDYYLCHPYYVHLVSIKTSILRQVGGVDETMAVSQDVDLGFRLIERCRTITHVPDVLYRWRMHGTSLSHRQFSRVQDATRGALERHLSRIEVVAAIEDRTHHNFRDIRFRPSGAPKVAILICSSGGRRRVDLTLQGIASTVADDLAETFMVDGGDDARDPVPPGVRDRGRLTRGVAAIVNRAVRRLDASFTHYLFLDADIEPLNAGWLDHMLGFATRGDVGVVGPLLFDPHCRISHAGLVLGLAGSVGRVQLGADLRMGEHNRNAGRNGELLCTRDVSAVSCRCMLVDAGLFHDLGGFDDRFLADFHDVDLCLRTRTAGKKVLFDAHALLLDHADVNGSGKPSRRDLRLLRAKHGQVLDQGDMFFHPLLSPYAPTLVNSPLAQARKEVRFRTTEVILPASRGRRSVARVDRPEPNRPRGRIDSPQTLARSFGDA